MCVKSPPRVAFRQLVERVVRRLEAVLLEQAARRQVLVDVRESVVSLLYAAGVRERERVDLRRLEIHEIHVGGITTVSACVSGVLATCSVSVRAAHQVNEKKVGPAAEIHL